jgi:hypothetical protein
MIRLKLTDHLSWVEERKRELGIVDAFATTEAMRNQGGGRTPAKRELLTRASERAKAAGKEPIVSYF